ncbi:organic cation transporter protein-like [Pieris brassicae]|uniref:organic cation transporter protein-like n=1 Tax=Pieris brassicae TaxID=7116 RepID=UPI001E65ED81|nr:organic cation transporter protein-like [Pieris brassicae]
MTSEDLIDVVILESGWYQALLLFLLIFGRSPTEFQLVNVVFILPNPEYICQGEEKNVTNLCPCEDPVYDTSIMSSVSSDFDLICERKHLASLGQSMLQVGILFGSVLYGYISDRFGRKTSCLISLTTEIIFVALSAAVTEFWTFAICRFLIGASVGGTMLCTYVMVIELTGTSFRPLIPGLAEAAYVICYMALPVIAYFLSDWKHLQLATSLPWLFVAAYYFVIPESPRWLITMGRKKEATAVLINMAKKQNKPTENIEAIVERKYEELLQNKEIQYGTYIDLFRTPKIRTYTVITNLVWMCCSLMYFGVNQYIGRLQGNIYLNVLLSASSLIPGLVLVVIATRYLNRRLSMIISCCVAAISFLVFLIIPEGMPNVLLTFAIIGLMGAHGSFVQAYLHTSEIFPTVVRNSALGLASVFARVGGFIAPFVVNIGVEWITIGVFSFLAFSTGFLCFFLPNTKDKELLNTISQVEQ